MKNLILISLGLCAFFVESTLSKPNCHNDMCLPANKACNKFYASHPVTVPETEKDATCTGAKGAGKLVHCCATESDAKTLREEMVQEKQLLSMKSLARAIMGAEENEYPHQVQFNTRGKCGGTVYNKNWIITAAHCVRHGNDPNNYTSKAGTFRWAPNRPVEQAYVIAGTSHVRDAPETNKYTIDKVIWHEDWKPTKIGDGHDIALLHLARPLALEKGKIQPMRLETADFKPNFGGNGVTIGFGNVNKKLGLASDDLMEAVAPIHHKATGLEMSFDPLNAEPGGTYLKAMHLAIGGGDSGVVVGQGDSGGPFICGDKNNKPILCGIASYKSCDPFKACRKPSYFQRVAPMLKWIKDNTNNEPQEENLFFDEPLFPEKVPDEKVPASLVRIIHREISCMGVIVTRKMVLTTAECADHDAYSVIPFIILHLRSENLLKSIGQAKLLNYKPNVSQNTTKYFERPINRNDMGFIIIEEVPAEYVVKIAPEGYQMKGRSVEYTYNKAVSAVEKRNYLEMDKKDCASKLRSLDKNLELTPDQLCMRQVYSAEKDCKRDLGGLLMCDNGKFFCGLGSFHACKANGFPEIFANYLTGRGTLRRDLNTNMKPYQ